jgi:hydroxymethylpyrimidine/phosphomethylpyrimidine kinase
VSDILICAGLDPSGGAGLIADVRIASELGVRPTGVVTALTVQNTSGVVSSEPVAAETVREQLELLLQDIEVRAVKIGMLGSSEIAVAIGAALALTGAPVVWDPVVASSLGDVPLVDSLAAASAALRPHLVLVTPNLRELELLVGERVTDAAAAGLMLAARLDAAVLVTGGETARDLLCTKSGVTELAGTPIPGGENVHGTGCALSTAIAAHLARGVELVDACRAAKQFVAERIAAPARPGRGAPAVV